AAAAPAPPRAASPARIADLPKEEDKMTTSSGSLIDSAWPGDCSRYQSAEVGDFSIVIDEIEAALVASGLLVGAAVTVHQGIHGDAILVAHVVPCALADFRPARLQEHLQA